MFRIGVPDFGPTGKPEGMNEAVSASTKSGDLGMLYIKPNGDYWQVAQNVDAVGVSGTNITGGGVAYWKNYTGYQCTPTVGNSTVNEVAGIYELVAGILSYCALRQGGTRKVKALSTVGVYARGDDVVAAAGSNAISKANGQITGNLSAAADTGGAILSVVNPFGVDVWCDRLEVIRTTKTTGACTADFGVTATSGTTSIDNLIDGNNMNAAEATETNYANGGTNGKVRQLWPAGAWITGSTATGAVAGLVGTYKIYYSRTIGRQVLGKAQGAIDGDGNVSVRLKITPA